MKIFITGTDTNVGKTTVSSWLCLHTKYDYFKPIQTGSVEGTDSQRVAALSEAKIYQEKYVYPYPASPYEAARLENEVIDISTIQLPASNNLIIEGAGGVLVPINQSELMVDLIKHLAAPVILVAESRLGMINHTLLSLEALRLRSIKILGVIINGEFNESNVQAVSFYGKVKVLAHLPRLREINQNSLRHIPLSIDLDLF
jgi:dethiobiotin synthetase